MSEASDAEPRASVLQEAIDGVVREFGYPDSIELEILSESARRKTVIEVRNGTVTEAYELTFEGGDDSSEPSLRRVSQ